ncbi:MAG: hypothetical protein EHM85_08970 [Desulfobacteraceae bacterium]|nr:MAG: hypothetical protein EHM85_08970 [Desulfobacteraceae bacterium]
MDCQEIKLLLHGIDTLQCAYFLNASIRQGINFEQLARQKEDIRQSKSKNPVQISLGISDFLLFPYGSSSGYPFVISNEDFKIEFGELNTPNYFVTFRSQALWRESAFLLHDKLIKWAGSVGYEPYKKESLSRVDFSFDYNLKEVDFDENSFVSRSSKDSQYRENGRVQTFVLGRGDIVLRVYDKVAEIKQQSDKVWFYILWGQDENVWRIEWQVRKPVLKSFGIKTFDYLKNNMGGLLYYLASEHDTLRKANDDSNSSRWPLHDLWKNLISQIEKLDHLGISRVYGQNSALDERMMRITISIYGYLKRIAAIQCVQSGKNLIDSEEAMKSLDDRIKRLHEPLAWKFDVEKRIKEIELGEW